MSTGNSVNGKDYVCIIVPYMFTNHTGTERIKRIEETWKLTCKDAKIGVRHFNDFRCNAFRNREEAGIPASVAIEKVNGRETRPVFDLYGIVDERNYRRAQIVKRLILKYRAQTHR
jgi:hypothetical protein